MTADQVRRIEELLPDPRDRMLAEMVLIVREFVREMRINTDWLEWSEEDLARAVTAGKHCAV